MHVLFAFGAAMQKGSAKIAWHNRFPFQGTVNLLVDHTGNLWVALSRRLARFDDCPTSAFRVRAPQ